MVWWTRLCYILLERWQASVLWEHYAFPAFQYCPRNEAYTSFYARLQCWPLPISLGPHLCWSGLCARLWMSLWISFSLCDDLPFLLLLQSRWTKLIFFVQKWQPCTVPWPSGRVICFSQVFQSECCINQSDVTFVFCCLFMSFSWLLSQGGGWRLHKGSHHSKNRNAASSTKKQNICHLVCLHACKKTLLLIRLRQ